MKGDVEDLFRTQGNFIFLAFETYILVLKLLA